jgi:hypothetical protein
LGGIPTSVAGRHRYSRYVAAVFLLRNHLNAMTDARSGDFGANIIFIRISRTACPNRESAMLEQLFRDESALSRHRAAHLPRNESATYSTAPNSARRVARCA